jgi:iron-sulfur cluster assembly protein
MSTNVPPTKLLVTMPALTAIDNFLSIRNKPKILRVGVRGGKGCSGFKYFIECAESFSTSKDLHFMYEHEISIVIDHKSMPIMNGSILFWVKNSKEQGLKFYNPNTKSTCSCGKSFSV